MQQNWNAMLTGVAEANEKAVAAATAFNRIAARAQSRFARRQFAAFEDCLDAGSKLLSAVTTGDAPQQVLTRHAEIGAELGEKLVAASQESIEIQAQTREELAGWLEEGIGALKAETSEMAVAAAPARKPRRSAPRKRA